MPILTVDRYCLAVADGHTRHLAGLQPLDCATMVARPTAGRDKGHGSGGGDGEEELPVKGLDKMWVRWDRTREWKSPAYLPCKTHPHGMDRVAERSVKQENPGKALETGCWCSDGAEGGW